MTFAISEKRHFKYNSNIANELFFSNFNSSFDFDELRRVNNTFVDASKFPNGTFTHEYVLEYLKSLDLKGFSVILPLSYGGSPKYIDAIKKKYSVLQSVKILENYLPIDEYYSIIASATTCIYGNFRQEA